MTRKWKNKQKKNDGSTSQQKGAQAYTSYACVEKKNDAFEDYYKKQCIVPPEDWDKFMSSLRDELPVTFRITGYRSHAQHMLSYLKGHYISELMDTVVDGVMCERPKPMPWYPGEQAWQFIIPKKSIRKMPEYKKLHDFLVSETESGNISRQEAVSMIPPLLLDVKPQHKVLDMCAAPGSKTAQLIELLHAEQVYGWPEGFVVANDSDNKRCYIMVHQAKRLNSPCCMIVCHDATVFPTIWMPLVDGTKTAALKYDRILCDVPCSGDGTLRKNFMIWKKWTLNSGLNLHVLQRRILQRGAELLEVGGRLVYSTCSFNPIENEAVVASVLQKCKGTMELLDVSAHLPGLRRNPGLTDWKVINDAGEVYHSLEDVPQDRRGKFKPSQWPPTPEEAERLNLSRCIRVCPHHQNTGGFFVAVLKKVACLPWMKQDPPRAKHVQAETSQDDATVDGDGESSASAKESPSEVPMDEAPSLEAPADLSQECISPEELCEEPMGEEPMGEESTDKITEEPENEDSSEGLIDSEPAAEEAAHGEDGPSPPKKKKKGFQGYKEDPFVFFKDSEELWPPIKDFYTVDDRFPVTQMLTRCHGGKKRNLYFVNRGIKSMLENNEANLKVINSGVKLWSRSDAKDVQCSFRLAQEGIYSLFQYLGSVRKIANVTKHDVRTLLTEENPFCYKLDKEAKIATNAAGQGSLIFVYDPKESDPASNEVSFVLVGWRGKNSVRSYIPKVERQHILRMCDIDIAAETAAPDAGGDGGDDRGTAASGGDDAGTNGEEAQPTPGGESGGKAGEPSAPSTREPSAPNTGEPSAPNTGEPSAPSTREPSAPNTGEPSAPNAGEPSAPNAREPPAANAGESPAPNAGESQSAPNAMESSAPNTGEPSAPNAGESQSAPKAMESSAPNTGEPSAPNAGESQSAPKAMESSAPNTGESPAPNSGESPAPNTGEPSAPNAGESQSAPIAMESSAPNTREPSAPNAGESQSAPIAMESSAPNTGESQSAPIAMESSAPNTGESPAPNSGESPAPNAGESQSAPIAMESSAPNTGESPAPNSGESPAPNAGESQSAPIAMESSAPNTGESLAPDTCESSAPNTGKSSAPNARKPSPSNAGEASALDAAKGRDVRTDSPRRDRHHHHDQDRNRKRDRDGDRHRDRDRHGHRGNDRDDENQRKRDFYFYYY